MAAMEAAVKLPDIQTSGIYQGKYRDRTPSIRSVSSSFHVDNVILYLAYFRILVHATGCPEVK